MEANKELQCNPRMATLMALHLVSQVLDEACVIANAAQDSGQPWQCITNLMSKRSCPVAQLDTTHTISKAVTEFHDSNLVNVNNLQKTPRKVATSTPQKAPGNSINKNQHARIGQGDQDTEDTNESMLITNLFDMSDVERDMSVNDPIIMQDKLLSNDLIVKAMKKLMDSFVESALNSAFGQGLPNEDQSGLSSNKTVTSSYSFLSDAVLEENEVHNVSTNDIQTEDSKEDDYSVANENDNIATFEKAFSTMNRDYEKYSDDDEPVLQDPKNLIMQEIELLPQGDHLDTKETKTKEFSAISGVSSSGFGSKKSSLIRRCRIQGARLLSCLRGRWWRRLLAGKPRESRMPGSKRAMCPLSPDTRRRTASLLDQRHLRTPSPSRSVVWKFNTVNEALIHSSQWKEMSSKIDFKNEN